MELNTIERNAVSAFSFLNFNSVRVVGSDLVERQNMEHHQREQHDGQRDNMKRKEAIQGDPGQQVIAADPGNDICPDDGYGAKQRYNDLRTPVRHLSPRQHVANKRLGH